MVRVPSGDLILNPTLSWLSFPHSQPQFPHLHNGEGPVNWNTLSWARRRSRMEA